MPAAAVAVRVNAIDSPWFAEDVAELAGRAGTRIGSLVVPKVESAGDVARVSGLLDSLGEPAAGVRASGAGRDRGRAAAARVRSRRRRPAWRR